MHIEYGVYLKRGLPVPTAGDGTGAALITMDMGFSDMPDAVWLGAKLPNAQIVSRSNNRDVQARLCMQGVGLAVLPRPVGDGLPGVDRIEFGDAPPGRDTWVGYHRDLKRQARLRALLDLVIERLGD
jgi:DNA-binding transcriptional LysR family regulator